jgi:hypothetical protein
MLSTRLKSCFVIASLCTISLALLALVWLTLISSPLAHAAAPAIAPAQPFSPLDIFTDTYEVNDTQTSAYFMGSYGQVPCASGVGVQIINNATFWRAGLPNPATDVDWYRVQLNAQLYYKFTVNQQTPSDIQFSISVFDSNNDIIYTQSNLNNATISIHSQNGGSYYLLLSASNAATIVGTENKPYQVSLCSSNVIIPATQTMTAFTYQGQLKHNGNPYSGTCDFQFSLWDDATLGSMQGVTQTITALAITNGLFTARLDFGSQFTGGARWLETAVRCTGDTDFVKLNPRQEVTAVPYALGLQMPYTHTSDFAEAPLLNIVNTNVSGQPPSIVGQNAGGDGLYGKTDSTSPSDAGVKGISSSPTSYGGFFSNTVATSGSALFANGDAKQSLSGNGLIKAGVITHCDFNGVGVLRSFNNVNMASVTVLTGTLALLCTIDFGFDVSNRYISVTGLGYGFQWYSYSYVPANPNRIEIWALTSRLDNQVSGGTIAVLVY